mgnify:CR=1 FL=1
MNKEIEYYAKEVYGNRRCYIKDAHTAKAIRTLTGRETLTMTDFMALEMLGYTFKLVLAP